MPVDVVHNSLRGENAGMKNSIIKKRWIINVKLCYSRLSMRFDMATILKWEIRIKKRRNKELRRKKLQRTRERDRGEREEGGWGAIMSWENEMASESSVFEDRKKHAVPKSRSRSIMIGSDRAGVRAGSPCWEIHFIGRIGCYDTVWISSRIEFLEKMKYKTSIILCIPISRERPTPNRM